MLRCLALAAVSAIGIGVVSPAAVGQEALRKHAAITGDRRPALCNSKETVALVLSVIERAAEAKSRGSAEKARNLYEIGARLQAEICEKPGADDAVFVRCDLGRHNLSGNPASLLKVTAVLRNEIGKGEQTFYSWSYLRVDPASDDPAEVANLDRRWCADEVADKLIEATPDRILQVQSRLYDLGANVGAINGQLTPDTIRAIGDFQRWAKLPVTGELTEQTFAKLNSADAPAPWVTIAFDGGGHFGVARAATRRIGEAEAVQRFRQRSQSDYKLSSTAAPNCIAIATTRYGGRNNGRRATFTQAFTGIAASADAARSNVVAYCEKQKGGGTCQIRDTVCAEEASRGDSSSPSVNARPPSRADPRDPPANSRPPRFDSDNPLTLNGRPPTLGDPKE